MRMDGMKAGAVVLAFAALAAGCSQQVNMQDPKEAQRFSDVYNADNVVYDINSRNGICYSFNVTRSMDTSFDTHYSVSHTVAPCTKEVLAEIATKHPEKLETLRTKGIEPVR